MNNPDLFQIERIGKGCSNIKWKDGQKELIVELYKKGDSLREISRKFGGLHYNTLKRILEKNDVPLKTRSQSHFLDKRNDAIFSIIDTEEKAYWLGFLCGDGCVHGNYIRIVLKRQDRSHLEKFRDFLGATSIKINDIEQVEKGKKYSSFSIGCKQIAQDLKKWGCVEQKSLILEPPQISQEFYLDWLRGLWDADGGISYLEKSNRWQSYLTSTKSVCEFFIENLHINTKPFLENRCENTWRVHFNGRLSLIEKLNLLYHNNTATIFLDRKHKLYEQLLATLHEKNAVNH